MRGGGTPEPDDGAGEGEAEALWARIEASDLDRHGARPGFVRRLARASGWDEDHAERVVEEYRRFAYLATLSPEPLAPSEAVERAWRLHRGRARLYWDEFCRETLRRPLRPEMSLAGTKAQVAERHKRALRVYAQAFGAPPPHDIWADVPAPTGTQPAPADAAPNARHDPARVRNASGANAAAATARARLGPARSVDTSPRGASLRATVTVTQKAASAGRMLEDVANLVSANLAKVKGAAAGQPLSTPSAADFIADLAAILGKGERIRGYATMIALAGGALTGAAVDSFLVGAMVFFGLNAVAQRVFAQPSEEGKTGGDDTRG